jgi:DNA-binding NarL/FixJ family response regulator
VTNVRGARRDPARSYSGTSSRRSLPAGFSAPQRPVPVAVVARAQLAEDFLIRGLQSMGSLLALPARRADEAEVVLILANETDEAVMKDMARVAEGSAGVMRPIILVCNRIGEHQVFDAVAYGLVSVLSWTDISIEQLVQAIHGSRAGRAQLPEEVLGVIMRRMRMMRVADAPSTQVSPREVDVIRLLADGLGTIEIANKLNFSERTIKNILAGLSARFDLHSRAHLVAFAFRNGII